MRVAMSRVLIAVAALTAAFLVSATSPARADHRPLTRYQITQLGSLGGPISQGSSINNRGAIAGFSYLPGAAAMHATVWRDGRVIDLGTLGGPNSAVLWPVKSSGVVVGVSETGQPNPRGEDWSCSAFFPTAPTHQDCVGFVWKHGHMTPLPTLGGDNGFATGADERGDVVGWAENKVEDSTCNAPQVLQFRAVRWDAHSSYAPHELAPLPGDTASAATAINNRGTAVGISGICSNAVGGFSAEHAIMWDASGTPTDLGTLGGAAWNTPMAINSHGDVTGFANVPGGATPGSFFPHAFLWTPENGIRDLGTLGGDDVLSEGLGMNDRGQVVGLSCTAHFASCRAFIWAGGVMTDLNQLVDGPGSSEFVAANDINNAGAITGQGVDQSGDLVAFAGKPVRR